MRNRIKIRIIPWHPRGFVIIKKIINSRTNLVVKEELIAAFDTKEQAETMLSHVTRLYSPEALI